MKVFFLTNYIKQPQPFGVAVRKIFSRGQGIKYKED